MELVRNFTEDQIIGMKEYQWQQQVAEMRDEMVAKLEAEGKEPRDYFPTMHNELVSKGRIRMTWVHRKELVR